MEQQPSSDNRRAENTSEVIATALKDTDTFQWLKDEIVTLDASERQVFLEALQAVERMLGLESERPSLKAIIKEMGPTVACGAIAFLILLPFIGPAAAAAGPAFTTPMLLAQDAVQLRQEKRKLIGRVRELRDAVIDTGKRDAQALRGRSS